MSEWFKTRTHIDPISAIDVLMNRNDIQAIKNIQAIKLLQTKPALPPSVSPIAASKRVFSQVHISIMENPKIDTNRKFLW